MFSHMYAPRTQTLKNIRDSFAAFFPDPMNYAFYILRLLSYWSPLIKHREDLHTDVCARHIVSRCGRKKNGGEKIRGQDGVDDVDEKLLEK